MRSSLLEMSFPLIKNITKKKKVIIANNCFTLKTDFGNANNIIPIIIFYSNRTKKIYISVIYCNDIKYVQNAHNIIRDTFNDYYYTCNKKEKDIFKNIYNGNYEIIQSMVADEFQKNDNFLKIKFPLESLLKHDNFDINKYYSNFYRF